MRKSISIGRLWTIVLGVAALLLMLVLPSTAAAEQGPTEEQIFADLNVDEVASDYVVLVDTSGSMAKDGRYNNVRTALRPFLAGLTSADHVAMYTFDDIVQPRYVGPAGATDAILDRLPSAPTREGHTDIGAALRSALDELGRSDAAGVASIVLLTDGINDPLAGSPYSGDTNGPAWTALHERATELSGTRKSFRGYALPLDAQPGGAQLLRQVVANTVVIEASRFPNIAGFLDQAKHATRVEKAQQKLAGDIGKGVVVEWPANLTVDMNSGAAELNLTLRSQMARAPLTLTNVHIDVKDAPATVAQFQQQPSQLTLLPGSTTALTIRLQWKPDAGPLPILPTASLEPTIAVRADVSSPWTAALAPDIPLKVSPEPVDGTQTIRYEATVGWWGTLPLMVLAAAIGIVVFRYFRSHPRLNGLLTATRPFNFNEGALHIPLTGRTTALSVQNGLPGHGNVRARRNGPGNDGVSLEITYSPDGSAGRASTKPWPLGGSVMIGGVTFRHDVEPATSEAGSPVQR